MMTLHDELCEFILRYKQHIEPQQRSNAIQCVEKCSELLFSQENEISKLKTDIEQLTKSNIELRDSVNLTRDDVMNNINDLRDMFNDLTRLLFENIDKKKHNNIDSMLYNINKIFDKLDNIPEF